MAFGRLAKTARSAMSSEEDFCLLTESSPEDSPLGCGSVSDCPERVELDEKQQQMEEPGPRSPEEDLADQKLRSEKAMLELLRQEEEEVLKEIQSVRAALSQEDALQERLKEQAGVFLCLPGRGVYLEELVPGAGAAAAACHIESRVVYPMEAGTALITFEEEAVAKEILEKKQHIVALVTGHRFQVEAQPVQLVVPKRAEIDSEICARRILVSDLPQMDAESLEDKLGFHFSRRANGGGDVESCQVMQDTRTAVVTFTEEGVVAALAHQRFHDIQVQKSAHQVRATRVISGQMSHLQVHTQVCSRTVLLRGIPDLLEQEVLQDLLVIHFQKGSNGGGEVQQCLYNPPGRCTQAVFSGRSKV